MFGCPLMGLSEPSHSGGSGERVPQPSIEAQTNKTSRDFMYAFPTLSGDGSGLA